MNPHTQERGATIIEVLIAVLLLAAISSAVAMAAMGGSSLRGAARLQVAMTSAGEQVQEDIATNRDWMKDPSCKVINAPCNIASAVQARSLELKDVDGNAQLVVPSGEGLAASSTALDSAVDGLGANDADGVLPDYYRIRVGLRPESSVMARYRVVPARATRVFVTTLDRRGVEGVGSVAVEICRVTNQADERMQVQGCAEGRRTDISEDGCAPGAPAECLSAFSWIAGRGASEDDPAPFVSLRRATASFNLVDASTGRSYPSSSADRVGGLYVFPNVPAGEFRLTGLPDSTGGNTERWRTKEIPTFHGSASFPAGRATINVEPGIRARALVMFRPRSTRGGIDFQFERRTHTYRLTGEYLKEETNVPKMAPTDDYIGASAADFCAYLSKAGGGYKSGKYAQETYRCTGLVPGPKNCVTIMVAGEYMKMVTPGTGQFIDGSDGMGAAAISFEMLWHQAGSGNETMTEAEARAKLLPGLSLFPIPPGTPGGQFCTYFAEFYTHHYMGRPTKTPRIRPGAVTEASYAVRAMPVARHLEFDSQGGYEEVPRCISAFRGQCTGSMFGYPTLAAGLKPGLDSRVIQSASAAKNENLIAAPAWTKVPMWVKPGGTIVSSTGGTHAAGTSVRVRGEGECYWADPTEKEGKSCNSCDPIFRGRQYSGACSILLRTDWRRPAWETIRNFDWYDGTGWAATAGEYPIEEKRGTIPYDPPWGCTSNAPIMVGGGTCSAPGSGGGGGGGGGNPYIPETHHRDDVGGNGVVRTRRVGSRT